MDAWNGCGVFAWVGLGFFVGSSGVEAFQRGQGQLLVLVGRVGQRRFMRWLWISGHEIIWHIVNRENGARAWSAGCVQGNSDVVALCIGGVGFVGSISKCMSSVCGVVFERVIGMDFVVAS